jgi:hypothetical protein
MIANPELKRHFWLELSAHRMFAMPVVLGLIFLLAFSAESESLPWVALSAFGLVTVLWGAHLTSESIFEEFRNATWDTLRRSALEPWQLTWGRLFGAPVFAWYGGAISLAAFVVSSTMLGFPHPVLPFLLSALGLAIFGHCLGAISALATTRVGRKSRSPVLIAFVLIALIALAGPQLRMLMVEGSVRWFGFTFSRLWFVVMTVWMFAAWGVVGFWRMMSKEMQERTLPTAWLGFAAWLTLYVSGLLLGKTHQVPAPMVFAGVVFFVTLSMSAGVVWFESRDYVTWRRVLLHWSASDFRRFLQEIPCWVTTMPVALVAAIVLAAKRGGPLGIEELTRDAWAAALVMWLFALRDIAILHFFGLGRRTGRVVITTVVYLVLLYLILPSLMSSLGLEVIAKLFWPDLLGQPLLALGVGMLNAGTALALVGWRWRERQVEAKTIGAG